MDLRKCIEGSTPYARNGGVVITVTSALVTCPQFSLANENTVVNWAANFAVPYSSANNPYTPSGFASITDTYQNKSVGRTLTEEFALDPANPNRYVKTIAINNTTPGRFRNTVPGLGMEIRDSTWGIVFGLKSQFSPAWAFTVRPGVVEQYQPRVVGPSSLAAGEVGVWYVDTYGHPVTYSFSSWTVDGVPDHNASEMLYRSLPVGDHVLTASVTRGDGSVETLTLHVSVAPCTYAGGCNEY